MKEKILFNDLGINKNILKILNKLNYKNPFKIQEKCIPIINKGSNLLGISETGSGKTIAFILPLLNKIKFNEKNTKILIIEPTRELAIQVNNVILNFIKYIKYIKTVCLYGGQNINLQLNLLKLNRNFIVGTPGRLLDHLNRKSINLNNLYTLVIDEADEMLKMGFIKDIKKIISYSNKKKQILLFSATMPNNLSNIVKNILNNYKKVNIYNENDDNAQVNKNINQFYYIINNYNKKDILIGILKKLEYSLLIIFTNTKKSTYEIYTFLKKKCFSVNYLNGDIKQYKREKILKDFKNNNFKILISTDVAARGIDINNIDWIINYNVPSDTYIYTHRIGRTGRAGKIGNSLLLIENNEINFLNILKKNNFILTSTNEKYNSLFIDIKINKLINYVKKINYNKINIMNYNNYILNILNSVKNKDINILLYILLEIIINNNNF